MKQRIAIATALVGLAAILGATVFRDQVALAAQSIDAHITNVDGNGTIKVHEQGTVEVTSGDVTTLAGSFAGVLEGGQSLTEALRTLGG